MLWLRAPMATRSSKSSVRGPGATRPFDEVRNKIRDRLNANREQAAYTSWLESQLRKARVLKDEELISKIKIETKGS